MNADAANLPQSFFRVLRLLAATGDFDNQLPRMMVEISKALDAERSSLFIVPWERVALWTKFAQGIGEEGIHLELKMGLIGVCVLTRKLINVSNVYEDPRFNADIDEMSGLRTESALCVPLHGKNGRAVGAIELMNKRRQENE